MNFYSLHGLLGRGRGGVASAASCGRDGDGDHPTYDVGDESNPDLRNGWSGAESGSVGTAVADGLGDGDCNGGDRYGDDGWRAAGDWRGSGARECSSGAVGGGVGAANASADGDGDGARWGTNGSGGGVLRHDVEADDSRETEQKVAPAAFGTKVIVSGLNEILRAIAVIWTGASGGSGSSGCGRTASGTVDSPSSADGPDSSFSRDSGGSQSWSDGAGPTASRCGRGAPDDCVPPTPGRQWPGRRQGGKARDPAAGWRSLWRYYRPLGDTSSPGGVAGAPVGGGARGEEPVDHGACPPGTLTMLPLSVPGRGSGVQTPVGGGTVPGPVDAAGEGGSARAYVTGGRIPSAERPTRRATRPSVSSLPPHSPSPFVRPLGRCSCCCLLQPSLAAPCLRQFSTFVTRRASSSVPWSAPR